MTIFSIPNPTVAKTVQAVLTNAVTVTQGDLVCGDPATGMIVAAATATATMIPVGFAARNYVGDGVKLIEVELFAPTWLYTFLNDATSNIAFAFVKAYVKDAQTVQALATSTVPLGITVNRTTTLATIAVGAGFSLASVVE
jgi:hypothetical protein